MKKILLYILFALFLLGCNPEKKELYKNVDYFIEKLETEYQSYGILGGKDEAKITKEGTYKIMPIGRLINVRIEHEASDKEYERLLENLKSHYKGDKRVKDIYKCQAGTLMVDCRN